MKVLVTGDREWPEDNVEVIEQAMAKAVLTLSSPPVKSWLLITGEATGVDTIALGIWKSWGHEAVVISADWRGPCKRTCEPNHRKQRKDGSEYCPAAGCYRNQQMIELKPDVVLAFPRAHSRGTWDTVRRAKKAKIPVIITDEDGQVRVG